MVFFATTIIPPRWLHDGNILIDARGPYHNIAEGNVCHIGYQVKKRKQNTAIPQKKGIFLWDGCENRR
jgi:hypothetical protein